MPLVSVIMPSYNHERFISEAIESVLNQTFTDLELIIIDDASKDSSKNIIKNYEEKDDRIYAIFHKKNKGIAKTMNEGLEEACGKFIAPSASDDVWVKDKLRKQLEVLNGNEDLAVWSEGLIIDAQSAPTGETFTQKHGASKKKKSGNIFEELLKGNYICGQSIILKRENLKEIRYDERLKYLNDYKFMVNLAKKYKFYFIPEPLVMYRIHGRNAILSDREGWTKDQIKIGEYFLQTYGDEISDSIKSEIFLNISIGFSYIGERAKARQYVYYAIKSNLFKPLKLISLLHIRLTSTNDDGTIRNFLRCSYQKYKSIRQRLTWK